MYGGRSRYLNQFVAAAGSLGLTSSLVKGNNRGIHIITRPIRLPNNLAAVVHLAGTFPPITMADLETYLLPKYAGNYS